jgi:branched-chain amino acid transport system permease protein
MADPAAQASLWAQLRTRWSAQPEKQRWLVSAGIQLLVAVFLWFALDRPLAVGFLILFRVLWLRQLGPQARLVTQAGIVAVLAIIAGAGDVRWSAAILFAIGFALTWIPTNRRWLLPGFALLGAILYPFVQSKMFTMPVFGVFPDLYTGVYMVVFVMMAVGLNIVVGYAGLLDLGYVAFYATGAYTAAWFSSEQFAHTRFDLWDVGVIPKDLPGIHVSLWLLLILAGVITAGFGVIIGLPTLRLRGDYLAVVTLGFGEILPQIARNGDSLFGFNLTNGPNGITPLDSAGWGHTLSSATGGFLPANYLTCCKAVVLGHHVQSADVFFWTALVLLVFTVFCSLRLRDSRLGRAWIAIREDETAAGAMGIPLMRTKTWAYATGAFFGGVAGAYYASFKSSTFPGDFFFNISVFILCMVILGGMGNVWGVIVGAALLAYLNEEGLANSGAWLNAHISFLAHIQIPGSPQQGLDVPLLSTGIYGVIIVVVMLLRPEGLIPSKRVAAEMHEGVHDEPAYDVEHHGSHDV